MGYESFFRQASGSHAFDIADPRSDLRSMAGKRVRCIGCGDLRIGLDLNVHLSANAYDKRARMASCV